MSAQWRKTCEPHGNEKPCALCVQAASQPLVHRFDFRGQALCGSSNHEDNDAPASHDPTEVTCPGCRWVQQGREALAELDAIIAANAAAAGKGGVR